MILQEAFNFPKEIEPEKLNETHIKQNVYIVYERTFHDKFQDNQYEDYIIQRFEIEDVSKGAPVIFYDGYRTPSMWFLIFEDVENYKNSLIIDNEERLKKYMEKKEEEQKKKRSFLSFLSKGEIE